MLLLPLLLLSPAVCPASSLGPARLDLGRRRATLSQQLPLAPLLQALPLAPSKHKTSVLLLLLVVSPYCCCSRRCCCCRHAPPLLLLLLALGCTRKAGIQCSTPVFVVIRVLLLLQQCAIAATLSSICCC